MAKAKGKKTEKTKVEVSAEGKSKLKESIKELKAERLKAAGSGDKKAVKAARYKLKRARVSLKKVAASLAKAKAAEKPAESAPAEGASE